jgi:hypothetical protein
MKKIILPILRVAVSIALILILLYVMRGKYSEIIHALAHVRVGLFIAGVLIFILTIAVASYRFKLIIDVQGETAIKFSEALSLTFIGYFFNNFLPTSIGGDVVKAYYLSNRTSDKMGSFTAVFIDRIMGLFTMIFMACLAIFLFGNGLIDYKIRKIIYGITAVCVIAIIFMANENFAKRFSIALKFFKPIEEKLKKAYQTINNYRHHKMLILKSVVISVISQLLFFTSIGVLALSIRAHIPAMELMLRMPIVSAISLLPSINGLGMREGSTVVMFSPIIGKESAFVVSILWFITLLIMSLIGGVVYMLSPQFKIKIKDIE